MPNIRIKDIPTTASATSSTDFIGIDGSANGTRKLNAYSPTFGGNLTVSGTATATNFIPSSGAAASGSIGGSSVYGLEIWGKTGSFSDLIIYNGAGNTLLTNLTGTQNISLAGNLTVSGGQALISHSGSYANIYFAVTGSAYSEIRAFSSTGEFRTNSGPSAGWGGFLTWQTDASEKMRLTNSGNLLLKSDGIDSSNGKLQLATHSSYTGGIGFGTDTALYRYGAGRLGLTHIGGNTPILYLLEGTTETARLWTANGPCYLDTLTAQPIYFRPNGTTALTLDSSQNATFAGTVTGTQFKSASGTTSAADGVATTVLSLSGKSGQMYLVHASLSGVNDAGNYAAFATVVMDGTSARIVSNNGTYMTLTLSGTNVQATQTSGVTQTIVYKYTSV